MLSFGNIFRTLGVTNILVSVEMVPSSEKQLSSKIELIKRPNVWLPVTSFAGFVATDW
jgi:hypothetical protein